MEEERKTKKYTVYLQIGTGYFKYNENKDTYKFSGDRMGNKVKLNVVVKRLEMEEQKEYDKAYYFLMNGKKQYSNWDKAWIAHCAVADFYEYGVNGTCEQYAGGFLWAANALGLQCMIYGNTDQSVNHAWNIVVVDGLAYPTDA